MKLTALQKELLVTWLQSHITLEQRRDLMREMPLVYSALSEQDTAQEGTTPEDIAPLRAAANLNAEPHRRISARRGKVS